MKIHLVGVQLFHADGRTDARTDELMDRHDETITVAFRSFANTPKNEKIKKYI
jgi:hypothetical protein